MVHEMQAMKRPHHELSSWCHDAWRTVASAAEPANPSEQVRLSSAQLIQQQ